LDPASIHVISFFIFLILAAFFSGLKTAFFSLNSLTLETFGTGSKNQQKILNLIHYKKRLILTLQTGIVINGAIAVTIAVLFSVGVLEIYFSPDSLIWGVMTGIAVYYLFYISLVEIFAINLAVKNPENYVFYTMYPFFIFYYLFLPLTMFFEFLLKIVITMLGLVVNKGNLTEKELRNMVNISDESNVLLKDEKDMIQGIFEMSDTVTREIMVPRTDVVCVEKGTSLGQLLKINKEKNHSRIPVYDKSIDNIVGILHIKDLLPLIKKRSNMDFDIMKLVNDPYFVPEQKRVNELLRELRTERIHLAIVVDEYGGTSGIVTLEDVIEEIVGEIQDEYDKELPQINRIDDDNFLVSGSILIDDLNEELDLHIPEEEGIDTLAGFLLGQFGSVPKTKSKISWNGYDFIIERVYSRRIERVRIIKTHREENAGNPA
jgi:CBS domain containing-hemolysin-like protein